MQRDAPTHFVVSNTVRDVSARVSDDFLNARLTFVHFGPTMDRCCEHLFCVRVGVTDERIGDSDSRTGWAAGVSIDRSTDGTGRDHSKR